MAGNPWFLIMTPADANQPGSQWTRQGAASQGKFSVRPIATEGWLALGIFVSIWTFVPVLIWTVGFAAGNLSIETSIIATIASEIFAVGGFILLVWRNRRGWALNFAKKRYALEVGYIDFDNKKPR